MTFILWFISCILLGLLAKVVTFNFWQGFILSIMITPPLALFAIIVCGEKKTGNI